MLNAELNTAIGMPYSGNSQGFSLIEVLVSMMVFAIGILGTASLQTVAKRANFDAVQRTTASQLAFDIFERMRANPAALSSYLAAPGAALGVKNVMAMPVKDCKASVCTPQEFASRDQWEWQLSLNGALELKDNANSGGLADATACVTGPADGSSGMYAVTIVWRGISEVPTSQTIACGAGSGLYGADDEYRRVMTVNTFISVD